MSLLHLLIVAVLFSCSTSNDNSPDEKEVVEGALNPDKTFQEIHNFGASDAWSCQFVGNWPDEKKNRIADFALQPGNK